MKIIFAGTPSFAASALAALLKERQIAAVLTQPDRPSGRGLQLKPSPVKQLAMQYGVPVLQPSTLKSEETQKVIADFNPDVIVVAAYGLILPKAVLQIPRFGCLNIHASLLPRWRGAAPIQRAILAGDTETGITIMQMDEGLDTGDMLLKIKCPIEKEETAETLHDKLANLGAQAIMETLRELEGNELHPDRQNADQATYATKLTKNEAMIDWSQDAVLIERAIRGYFPFPVAFTYLSGTAIKILKARLGDENKGEPGTVLKIEKNQIQVACGKGSIALEVLQKPGGKPLPVAQFLQGFPIKAGDGFGLV